MFLKAKKDLPATLGSVSATVVNTVGRHIPVLSGTYDDASFLKIVSEFLNKKIVEKTGQSATVGSDYDFYLGLTESYILVRVYSCGQLIFESKVLTPDEAHSYAQMWIINDILPDNNVIEKYHYNRGLSNVPNYQLSTG